MGIFLHHILEKKRRGVQMLPVRTQLENYANAVKVTFAAILACLTVIWRFRKQSGVQCIASYITQSSVTVSTKARLCTAMKDKSNSDSLQSIVTLSFHLRLSIAMTFHATILYALLVFPIGYMPYACSLQESYRVGGTDFKAARYVIFPFPWSVPRDLYLLFRI